MLREVKCPQRAARLLGFRVTGTGTAAIAEGTNDAALTDNGTGDYTLTFTKPFARTPVVSGNSITTNAYVQIGTISATAIQILTKNLDDDTALDASFHLHVLGFDVADQI